MKLLEKFKVIKLKKRLMVVVGVILLVALFALCIRWIHYRFTHAITDNAFVCSDLINVSPRVPGHIMQLLVDESDKVTRKQIVALLNPIDYNAQVELHLARLEKAKKSFKTTQVSLKRTTRSVEYDILIAEKGIEKAKEGLKKAEADFKRIEKDFERIKNLYKTKSIPKHRLDMIKAEKQSADAVLSAAEIAISIAEDQYRKALVERLQIEKLQKYLAEQQMTIKVAEKALSVTEHQLEHTKIKSPVNGVVAKKFIFAGDYANPGFPILSIYDTENIFVRAHLEETKMEDVRLGQTVDLEVDTYPGRCFHGKVIKIGEATGAQFMLIPRDTTTGEFTKVVQRIPIKISILDDPENLLKPGYSVTIGIKTD